MKGTTLTPYAANRHPVSAGRTAPRARLVMMALFVLIAGSALTVGCSDITSPEENDDNDGYPARTSHGNVVAKLEQAYAAMDTTAFADCLATTFEFWLNPGDLNDPGNPLPAYWGRSAELSIARNMFGPGTDVLDIQLTLTQIGEAVQIPPADPGDPSTWEHVCGIDLFVYLPGDLILWANGAARFGVSVDPDETGPAGETLWEISKWEDIDLGGRDAVARYPQDDRFECATWGGIKALYR